MRRIACLPAVRWAAIAATVVNFDIHVALAINHGRESLYIGVLFVIGSALLGAVAAGLSSDRDSRRTVAWAGGSIVCAGEFILFIASRTIGLPAGYHETWARTTEDRLGLVSLFTELVFMACAAASLARGPQHRTTKHPLAGRLRWHNRTAPLP